MTQKLKTVHVTATMTTDLELYINVPEDMTKGELWEKIRHDGAIDGGDLTEVESQSGDWTWEEPTIEEKFRPDAPAYFND